MLNNLAVRLHKRYESDHREADHTQVLETFRTAIKEGLEHSRGEALKAARNWVNQSFGLRNWAEVVEAYGWFETAAAALLRIQAERRDKEDWLRDLARVPSRAAVAFAHRRPRPRGRDARARLRPPARRSAAHAPHRFARARCFGVRRKGAGRCRLRANLPFCRGVHSCTCARPSRADWR